MPSGPPVSFAPYQVVAIVASAGGHAAVANVLRSLPDGFAVPIIVVQHLAAESLVAETYRRRVPMPVARIEEGSRLQPGVALVAPGRVLVDLMPDGSCALRPSERGALDYPFDHFLDTVARSFGRHAIAVVLTGMGRDGAAGARRVRDAEGRVIVQSEASAECAEMPGAAIQAGAGDLVVPLGDIGQVIGDIVAGTRRPVLRSEVLAVHALFGGDGAVRAVLHQVDWRETALGPVMSWPRSLNGIVRAVLASPIAMVVHWGEELIQIANDEYLRAQPDARAMQGRPARDRSPDFAAQLARVVRTGEVARHENAPNSQSGNERFVTLSHAPLTDDSGTPAGVLSTALDTTPLVVAERRINTIRELVAQTNGARTANEAVADIVEALARNKHDVAHALVYSIDKTRQGLSLVAASGVSAGSTTAPHWIDLRKDYDAWPVERALEEGTVVTLNEGVSVIPLRVKPTERPGAVLIIAATEARLASDSAYRAFCDIVAARIASVLAEAQTLEAERLHVDQLLELDRAKTQFFANVSHEFRTPLTLLLAPLEELLREREALPRRAADDLIIAVRNARRLLGLVNNLLDFSQLDERRRDIPFEDIDLAAATTDATSAFRSAIEAAGLELRLRCEPGLPLVTANREMWERIVSNLVANAFKFTFKGHISVIVRPLSLHAELVVADSGIGIPTHELRNIFKRFHRVRGARARTAEGAGIGLSLVDDLVKRMGGQIRVASQEGVGTTFTVWMPYKSARALAQARRGSVIEAAAAEPRDDLAREAARWSVQRTTLPEGVLEDLLGPPSEALADARPRERLVVVDDNADMRDYLRRLLESRWEVHTAPDGEGALAVALRVRPAVLVADVMMPNLDGFELLRRVRQHPELSRLPVVLVTARAGEDAAIEGLLSGADDYVAKPFSPRELLARVRTVVERARAEAALRESEAKIRTMFETMIEACCIFEMIYDSGKPVDWRILEANAGYEKQSGLKDVAGKLASEVMPGTETYWIETFGRVVETGEPEQIEKWHQPSGRWIHSSTARVGGSGSKRLVSVFYDITERKRVEAALRESEEKFRSVFETIEEGFCIIEVLFDASGKPMDYRFLETNRWFQKQTGFANAVGKTVREFAPHHEQHWFDIYGRVARTGESVRFENEAKTIGAIYDVHAFRVGAPGENRVAVLFHDITERKSEEHARPLPTEVETLRDKTELRG